MSHRMSRVNEQIKKELSFVMFKELDDPRIKRNLVTFTKVETSKDLHHAKVYFTCIDSSYANEVIDSLNGSRAIFLAILRKRLKIRYIPNFKFLYDSSIEKTNEVLKTIRDLRIKEEAEKQGSDSNSGNEIDEKN